jgi:hypothetical protein
MSEAQTEFRGKCGADIDPTHRVDFTPKKTAHGFARHASSAKLHGLRKTTGIGTSDSTASGLENSDAYTRGTYANRSERVGSSLPASRG